MGKNKDKAKIAWVVGIGVFAFIGICAFLLGYGLRDGWEAVLAWFTSKWAYIIYTAILVYATFAICYIHFINVGKELK